MKKLVLIFAILFSGTLMAQHGDKVVGIRINTGSPGKDFNPHVFANSNAGIVDVDSEGENVSSVEVYDADFNLITVREVNGNDNFTVNGLNSGVYYMALVSENNEVRMEPIFVD